MPANDAHEFVVRIQDFMDDKLIRDHITIDGIDVYLLKDDRSDGDFPVIRFVASHDLDTDLLVALAYDVAIELFSETIGDDACDILVRERSGHLNAHSDLIDFHHGDQPHVIVDVLIQDSMS